MALAHEIEELVRLKPGLTEIELARMVQSPASYLLQVRSVCRRLVAEGRLERQGKGGWAHPFTYHPRELGDATPFKAVPTGNQIRTY
jgi:hypothetical protein